MMPVDFSNISQVESIAYALFKTLRAWEDIGFKIEEIPLSHLAQWCTDSTGMDCYQLAESVRKAAHMGYSLEAAIKFACDERDRMIELIESTEDDEVDI